MSIDAWNERYRAGEQLFETPSPLVERFAGSLAPGDALDLACGPGRNALYLASLGWRVTAVDGSAVAIDLLRAKAQARLRPDFDDARSLRIEAQVADLEQAGFSIPPGAFDLICDCYYLQRNLFDAMKTGLRPGGLVVVIAHLAEADQPRGTAHRAIPGELAQYFEGWSILHSYEGRPAESGHSRAVAELVARKPA